MRIKKTSQYIEGGATLSNEYGTSQNNGYSQEYINKNIGGTLLWTNPSPSSSMSPTNITVEDMSNYDIIEVWFRQWRTDGTQRIETKTIKGDQIFLIFNYLSKYQGNLIYITRARVLSIIDNTTIQIGQGYQNYNGTLSESNDVSIPEYIIGYKTGLFS